MTTATAISTRSLRTCSVASGGAARRGRSSPRTRHAPVAPTATPHVTLPPRPSARRARRRRAAHGTGGPSGVSSAPGRRHGGGETRGAAEAKCVTAIMAILAAIQRRWRVDGGGGRAGWSKLRNLAVLEWVCGRGTGMGEWMRVLSGERGGVWGNISWLKALICTSVCVCVCVCVPASTCTIVACSICLTPLACC